MPPLIFFVHFGQQRFQNAKREKLNGRTTYRPILPPVPNQYDIVLIRGQIRDLLTKDDRVIYEAALNIADQHWGK